MPRGSQRVYSRRYYEKNRDKVLASAYRSRKKAKARNRRFIKKYFKTHPCVDCGYDDPRALQFDHIRGKKFKDISTLVHRGYGLDTVKKEIEKCEVRCANCHSIRTFEDHRRKRLKRARKRKKELEACLET